jgi:UDP-3-O-[3-hydroxymyristoyl] N-acetylglucosamine deacetylase
MDIVIHQKIGIGEESLSQKHLYLEPFDGFEVVLRVDYPAPIHEQKFRFAPAEQSFEKEIAPARSFNTFENIDLAQKAGVAGSGYLNSHIIIHDGKVINTKLIFPDEFVRHKILDLLGDLALLGYGLRARVVGNMTSHGLNQALALKVHEALSGNQYS